jgi:fructuronate reductase/mannitol 2-dehydrogenase
VSTPSYAASELAPSIVHLGLGSFARAHLCAYLDELSERRVSRDWGLVAGGLRTASIAEPLAAQDHLWTLLPGDLADVRVVGVLRGYVDGVRERSRLLALLAARTTRLVTLTVTASAYESSVRHDGDVFDLLAEALDRRRAAGRGPFTVLSCDNLPDNGALARAAVLAATVRHSPGLTRWVERHVAFPRSMVDRIAHCADEGQLASVRGSLGVDDRLAVVTEAFSQWVLADEFCAGRPPLEEVGVQVVPDVSAHVEAKTRLLNGSHVALGFLGSRAGHATAAEAMRDPAIAHGVRAMMREEIAPGLAQPVGMDLTAYQTSLLHRLGDEGVQDPLSRLCRRGSIRMHNYVVPSLRDALADGRPHARLTQVVAAWIAHVAAAAERRDLASLEDPHADRLAPLALRARHDPNPLLAVAEVFDDLGQDVGFVNAVRQALTALDEEEPSACAS